MKKKDDLEYRDVIIRSVRTRKNGYDIIFGDGAEFFIYRKWGVKPHAGDTARLYGRGEGFTVRGVDINGQECFYRTPKEEIKRNVRWVKAHGLNKKG